MARVTDEKNRSSRYEWLKILVVVAAMLAVWQLFAENLVTDLISGVGYKPTAAMQNLKDDLELTSYGARIFGASRPTLEKSEKFNQYCENDKQEVALLGCYNQNLIYVYEITAPELVDSNKVTLAHELLHAGWARLKTGERRRAEELLNQVMLQNAEWFESELASYHADAKIEEAWARAGTKLEDLPAELEKMYAKYFQNRVKIVQFYKNYEAPFKDLREKSEKLYAEILQNKKEIEQSRATYLNGVEKLDQAIEEFNKCADTAGCFDAEGFAEGQSVLMLEQERLETERVRLNQKIDENNARVEQLSDYQAALGELNSAMDSRVELVKE